MQILFRLLLSGLLITTHATCLIIIGSTSQTFADLWFYYCLLFLVAPAVFLSMVYYLAVLLKKKQQLASLKADLALWSLLVLQNLSIFAALQHWI